jgi:hypothetical protein
MPIGRGGYVPMPIHFGKGSGPAFFDFVAAKLVARF